MLPSIHYLLDSERNTGHTEASNSPLSPSSSTPVSSLTMAHSKVSAMQTISTSYPQPFVPHPGEKLAQEPLHRSSDRYAPSVRRSPPDVHPQPYLQPTEHSYEQHPLPHRPPRQHHEQTLSSSPGRRLEPPLSDRGQSHAYSAQERYTVTHAISSPRIPTHASTAEPEKRSGPRRSSGQMPSPTWGSPKSSAPPPAVSTTYRSQHSRTSPFDPSVSSSSSSTSPSPSISTVTAVSTPLTTEAVVAVTNGTAAATLGDHRPRFSFTHTSHARSSVLREPNNDRFSVPPSEHSSGPTGSSERSLRSDQMPLSMSAGGLVQPSQQPHSFQNVRRDPGSPKMGTHSRPSPPGYPSASARDVPHRGSPAPGFPPNGDHHAQHAWRPESRHEGAFGSMCDNQPYPEERHRQHQHRQQQQQQHPQHHHHHYSSTSGPSSYDRSHHRDASYGWEQHGHDSDWFMDTCPDLPADPGDGHGPVRGPRSPGDGSMTHSIHRARSLSYHPPHSPIPSRPAHSHSPPSHQPSHSYPRPSTPPRAQHLPPSHHPSLQHQHPSLLTDPVRDSDHSPFSNAPPSSSNPSSSPSASDFPSHSHRSGPSFVDQRYLHDSHARHDLHDTSPRSDLHYSPPAPTHFPHRQRYATTEASMTLEVPTSSPSSSYPSRDYRDPDGQTSPGPGSGPDSHYHSSHSHHHQHPPHHSHHSHSHHHHQHSSSYRSPNPYPSSRRSSAQAHLKNEVPMPMRVSSSSTSGRHPQSISYPSSPQASHHEPSSSGVAHGHGHGPSNYAEHPDRSAAAYAPGSGSDVLPERRHGGMHYQSASEPYQSGHWSDGSGVGGYESGAREVGHHGRYASAQGSGGSTGAFDSGARPLSPLSVAPASTASGPSGPSAPSAAAHWRDSHQRTIRQSVSEPDLASLESNRRQHYRRATEHQDEGPEDREDDLEEDELEEDELEEDERRMLAEMDDQEQEDERGRRPSKNASRPRNATSSSNVASRMYNQSQADPSTRLRYHAEHDQGAMFDGRGPPPSTQSYPHGSGSRDATYASGHGGHPYQYGGPHSRPNAFFQHSPYPPHHGQPQQPTIPHYHRSQQGPLPGVNPGHDQAPNGVDKNGSAASSSTSATTTAGTAAGTTARRGPYLSRQRALLVGLENTSPSSRYQCSYCLKRFSRPSSLRIHTYSHTGERPFRCSEEGCGRQFSVQSNMRRHLRVHRLGRLRSEFSGSSSTSTGPVTTTSASAATLAPAPATAGAV